jgi:nucleoside 2-deoxyribosyltransferase
MAQAIQPERILLYFAGPLFSAAEKRFNQYLTDKIEALGHRVFLPQRDGVEKDRPPYDTMTPDERRHAIFALDKQMIDACEVFLFVLDGRVPDEGACVELGMAYAQKVLRQPYKRLIGFHSDIRAAFIAGKLNPMVRVPLETVVETEEALLELLEQHRHLGTGVHTSPLDLREREP